MSETSTIGKLARAAARERFKHLVDLEDEPSAAIDPDNPPLTDEQLGRLRPAADVLPKLVAASLRRRTSRSTSRQSKVAVSIQLDADVVEALRSGGEGWQSRTNEMLRKALGLAT